MRRELVLDDVCMIDKYSIFLILKDHAVIHNVWLAN